MCRVESELDADELPFEFYLMVGAVNDCEGEEKPELDRVPPASRLNVTVDVMDINDNPPELPSIQSYYVFSTEEGECQDCTVAATDRQTLANG